MSKDSEILFKIINILIEKSLSKISYDKEGIIISKTDSGGYKVVPNGEKHDIEVKNGIGLEFKRGDKCLIHFINGDNNNRVIIAKL